MTLPSRSSTLATLISQFQAQHPKGSLITELLTIHEGNYVVRALVQIGGMTVTTGMATATAIEQAEDRARIRALEAFGSSSQPLQPSAYPVAQMPLVTGAEALTQPSPTPTQSLNGSALPTTAPIASKTQFQEPLEAIAPTPPPPTPHPTAWENPTAVPADTAPVDTTPVDTTPVDTTPTDSLLPPLNPPPAEPQTAWDSPDLVADDFAATAPPPLTSEPFDSYQNPYPNDYQNDYQNEYQQDDYQKPEDTPLFNLPVDEPPAKSTRPRKTPQRDTTPPATSSAAPDASYDRSEELAQILVQMKRLNWSKEQGRNHLKQTYGKNTRQELDDDQLLDFLNFLKAQPSPTNSLL